MNLTGVGGPKLSRAIYLPRLQVRASNVNIVPYRCSVCGRLNICPAGIMTKKNKNSLLTHPPTTAQTRLTGEHITSIMVSIPQ